MSLPELNLSLSSTDNPGSPLYAGVGEFEEMGEFDSALGNYTITIIISDEEIGKVTLNLNNSKSLNKIELPTYKMSVYDDKTEETSYYEVTRDTLLFKNLQKSTKTGFSLFGIKLFQKEKYTLPAIIFEPLKEEIEKYEVSRYRTMQENFLSFVLRKERQNAYLVSGLVPEKFFDKDNVDSFFLVVDNNNGQKFMGDIKYREKFIRKLPRVKIHLIKRKKAAKEMDFNRSGKVNKIVYI